MAATTWNAPVAGEQNNFRAMGAAMRAALAAVGMVQTSDAGQINWTTATWPSAGAKAGYEVWRFDDALQSTFPLFLKIEYGSASTASALGFWLTLGKGSDGAGNITGQIVAGITCWSTYGTATPTATQTCYAFSGDKSMLGVVIAPAYPNYLATGAAHAAAPGFLVERERNPDGTPRGDSAIVVAVGGSNVNTYACSYAAATFHGIPGFPAAIPKNTASNTSLSSGGQIPVFTGLVVEGQRAWTPRCLVSGMRSDLPVASFDVPGLGTYFGMGPGIDQAHALSYAASTNYYGSCAIGWW